jgi:hypothetical protein
VVWNLKGGEAVAVFLDRDQGEALLRVTPRPPQGGWRLVALNELELLAWLREKRADGVSQLLLNATVNADPPATMGCYVVELSGLLDSGNTLALFRQLADSHDTGGGESGQTP